MRVVIHFPSNKYRDYWRLIPNDNKIDVDDKNYSFDKNKLINNTDIFAVYKEDKLNFEIDGKKYNFDEIYSIRNRRDKFPEIHFFHNNPCPFNFNDTNKNPELEFSSHELKTFKDNDLFVKLLTMKENLSDNWLILILIGFNVVVTCFLLAKTMGWIE